MSVSFVSILLSSIVDGLSEENDCNESIWNRRMKEILHNEWKVGIIAPKYKYGIISLLTFIMNERVLPVIMLSIRSLYVAFDQITRKFGCVEPDSMKRDHRSFDSSE